MSKVELKFGELGGKSDYYDETFPTLSSPTITCGFQPSQIFVIAKYSNENATMVWSSFYSSKFALFRNSAGIQTIDVGSGAGIASVTSTGFTFNSQYYTSWTDVHIIAIP